MSQELNVLPYPAIIANCVGWVGYSFVKPNGFVLGPNAPGILIGFFYMMTCMPLVRQRTADWVNVLMLFYSSVFIIVGAITCYADLDEHARRLLWGYTSNAILITYYASPLSTLYKTWRTRDASSLSLPLATANAINGALWVAYGIAIHDNFITVPNAIGLLLAIILLASIFTFWKSRNGKGKAAFVANPGFDTLSSNPSPGTTCDDLLKTKESVNV